MNKQDLQKLKKLRQKRDTRRRFIMYGVLGVLVATLTTAIVLIAEGYYFNPSAKQVIQNGLVLVDSTPKGASVTINNRLERDRTESRFTLPQGSYAFTVSKKGYRNWTRRFALAGSEVVDLNYIRLIPSTITSSPVTTFSKPLTLFSQSPDRKWLLTHTQDTPLLEIADMTAKTYTATKLTIPADLAALNADLNTAKIVEWASDNEHALLRVNQGDQLRFWIISRSNPTEWVDVSARYGLTLQRVTLRDRKWNKLFVLDANGDLRDADLEANTVSAPRLQRVLHYNAFGTDKLVVAEKEKNTERVNYVLMEKNTKKTMFSTTAQPADDYLLDIAQYDGDWYAALGSKQDRAIKIFLNPFEDLKANSATAPKPLTTLDAADPRAIGYSAGAQFLAVQDGNGFVVFDFEYQRTYRYGTGLALESPDKSVDWLDGNHLILRSAGEQHILDYDGLNLQSLGKAKTMETVAFDKDTESYYGLVASDDGATDTLTKYSLIAKEDVSSN